MANIIQKLFGLQKRATHSVNLRDPALVDLLGGRTTEAGVRVDESSALTCATVWAAVRVISESAASLPLITYRREGSTRSRASDHPLYNLLHDEPCPGIGSLVWREALFAHALTYGNGYAEIERRVSDNTPVALWLLSPDRVEPYREMDGNVYYKVTQPKGGHVTLAGANVIHLRGLGGDGLVGYSVIRTARESLGLTIAAQQFGAKLFGTGARPSGVLEHPGRLSDDARQRLRADYERLHSGLDNAHRIAILEEGMKWQALGVPPDDAQFLQTRQFQVAEVARWFNVPSSKLRDNTGQTYSSIEAENQAFYTETLRPWLIRFEQELQIKLLNSVERRQFYFEHLIEGLLRADIKTRFDVYALAKNWGILSTNEIRERENLPPIDGGDQYLQPLNMQPLDAPTGPSAPTATPALAPAPSPSADSTPAGAGAASSRAVPQKYSRIDFTPPQGVRDEAAKGLEWRDQYGRGGTLIGVARARDLSNGARVSPETIKRMASYFARHEVDKQGTGWSPGQDGFPSAGRIAWALWGGDPGQAWANKVNGQMQAADEEAANARKKN